MIITIGKINRQQRSGVSPKNGKEYNFESLGILPLEDKLLDINGDEFQRDGRWLSGISVKGVTDDWEVGDKVKVIPFKKTVKSKDGSMKEVINFKLPEGVDPMVKKVDKSQQPDDVDPDDY